MQVVWTPVTPGDTAQSGQVNQFLVPHQSILVYLGPAVASNAASTASAEQSAPYMAQGFTLSATTNVAAVQLLLSGDPNTQQDVIVGFATNVNNAPSFPLVTETLLPWQFIGSTPRLITVPVPTQLQAGSYFLVLQTVSSGLGGTAPSWGTVSNSTSGLSGYITTSSNGSSWSAVSGQQAVCGIFQNTNGYPLVAVFEDNGIRWTTIGTHLSTMVQKPESSQVNLLLPADASFAGGSFATWTAATGTTITVDQVNGQNMLALTGTASTLQAATGIYQLPPSYVGAANGANLTGLVSALEASPTNVTVTLNWYQSSGSPSAITPSNSFTGGAGTYTPAVVAVTAEPPSDAAAVSLQVSASQPFYVSNAALLTGSSAIWCEPGNAAVAVRRPLNIASSGQFLGVS